ncbi:MAG: hypothetical protein V4611_00225 [Patescibacteria group bacterium]
MSLELPRFNQKFVNRLEEGSTEQQFVSSVGDVTFLTMANLRTLHEIQADLREPLYHMDLNSEAASVERAIYFESYSGMFEEALIGKDLHEYVIALNGLKNAATNLKGRNVTWSDGRHSTDGSALVFDEYIGESMIGFYPNSVVVPVLSIELAKEAGSTGRLIDIESMWDIEIHPS